MTAAQLHQEALQQAQVQAAHAHAQAQAQAQAAQAAHAQAMGAYSTGSVTPYLMMATPYGQMSVMAAPVQASYAVPTPAVEAPVAATVVPPKKRGGKARDTDGASSSSAPGGGGSSAAPRKRKRPAASAEKPAAAAEATQIRGESLAESAKKARGRSKPKVLQVR